MIRNQYLEKLRDLFDSALQEDNVKVVLFGSSATGKYKISSDIDIGILAKGVFDVKKLTLLKEDIGKMNIPYKVEVVYLNETSTDFKDEALKGAVIWKD